MMDKLKCTLDNLYASYGREYLRTDPLRYLHRYGTREDQEIVGFLASSLAYGRVERINLTLGRVLDIMGESPFNFVTRFDPLRHIALFDSIIHRFHTGRDIAALVHTARQMYDGWGSIEKFFISRSTEGTSDIGQYIEGFSRAALDLDYSPFYTPEGSLPRGVRFTFPLPGKGSACKRLNLYLRWMVRGGDGVDLGLWRSMDPSDLLIPLDTHVSRVAYAIGLTDRRQASWKAVCEVTASLAELDPADPVKYDFSLCRLGILKECTAGRVASKCTRCPLKGICRYS
jgi:uncharacterized protein (TIGR02757 family)